jgi:hypothetical protein
VIADAGIGSSFMAHAAYLGYGPRGSYASDRVAWAESRNLPTAHMMAAARIMLATARDSDSVQPPVYRFSISFDPSDPVNPETMRRVADRTLADLGLSGHQVLIVAHRDTAHPHMHLMVNRVHPERLNVWNNWNDWARIEKSLRAQEVELGLRIVPGKHAPVPEQARDRVPARARKLARGDSAWMERVRRVAAPHLLAARSWEELGRDLHAHGLSVRVDGGGMVVTDGVFKAKCSDIDRAAARKQLEGRLGAWRDRTRLEPAAPVALPEPSPGSALEPAPEAPPRAVRTGPGAQYRAAARDFSRELAALYHSPERARRAFLRAAQVDGRERAVRALHAQPEAFGAVRDRSRAPDAAGAASRFTAFTEDRVRPALRELAGWIREHERTAEWEASTAALTRAERTARQRAADAATARAARLRRVREVRAGAPAVYADPDHAAGQIARAVRRDGAARAALALAQEPERFGRLRAVEGRRFGLFPSRDESAARAAAVDLAEAVRGAVRAWEAAPSAGEAWRTAGEARRAALAVEAARRHAPPRTADEALHRAALLADELRRAGHDVAARLAPMLPPQAIPAVRQAVSLGRGLARAIDPDRERGGPSL